jgi:hypothetical protein
MLESWKFINQVPLKTLKPNTETIDPIKRSICYKNMNIEKNGFEYMLNLGENGECVKIPLSKAVI